MIRSSGLIPISNRLAPATVSLGPATGCFLREGDRENKEGTWFLMTATSIREIQPRAQTALANSPIHELRSLQVEERGDALLISGSVSTFYHKQLAQEVVRSVCKGTEVVNSIRVE